MDVADGQGDKDARKAGSAFSSLGGHFSVLGGAGLDRFEDGLTAQSQACRPEPEVWTCFQPPVSPFFLDGPTP